MKGRFWRNDKVGIYKTLERTVLQGNSEIKPNFKNRKVWKIPHKTDPAVDFLKTHWN